MSLATCSSSSLCVGPSRRRSVDLSASRRLAARRSGQRGVVMIEAVIVSGFLLIGFFCVVGIGGLYKAKLIAMQEARFEAAHNAVNNCDISGTEYPPQEPPSILAEVPPSPPELSPEFGIDLKTNVQEGGGVSHARSSGQFTFGPGAGAEQSTLFSPITGQVSSQSWMACNEKKLAINVLQYVERVVDDIRQTMGNDTIPPMAEQAIGM